MQRVMRKGAALLALCLGMGACGSEEDEGAATGAMIPEMGTSESALVTAAEGGELRAGDFELRVPAGALRDDTELTLEVRASDGLPEARTLRGPVYELGPDGTQFEMAVDIELPVERLPKANERAEVVWLDEEADEWVPVASDLRDGRVVAKVDHFTAFSVRFVVDEDGDVVQDGGMCAEEFNACGGNIEGTWGFEAACLSAPDADFGGVEGCAGQSLEASIDVSGEVTFADGMMRGMQTTEISVTVSIPSSCLPDGSSCADLGAESSSDGCTLSMSPPSEVQEFDDTYTVDGGLLFVGGDDEPVEFCVQGDTLTVFTTGPEDGTVISYVARRR